MAIDNIKEFQKQVGGFVKHAKDISEDEIRKAAFGIGLRGLILKTPIDEGTARGNWNVALESKDTSVDELANANAGIAKGRPIIEKFKMGQTIYFTNALPYIVPLEFGYSAQAPNGMLRLTFQELINYFKNKRGKV